jgi:hypothetical protein
LRGSGGHVNGGNRSRRRKQLPPSPPRCSNRPLGCFQPGIEH